MFALADEAPPSPKAPYFTRKPVNNANVISGPVINANVISAINSHQTPARHPHPMFAKANEAPKAAGPLSSPEPQQVTPNPMLSFPRFR